MEYKFINNNGITGTAKPKQHRIRTYNRKIEIIPKDKNNDGCMIYKCFIKPVIKDTL